MDTQDSNLLKKFSTQLRLANFVPAMFRKRNRNQRSSGGSRINSVMTNEETMAQANSGELSPVVPPEATSDVLNFLNIKILLNFRLVNRDWNELAITKLRQRYKSHVVKFKTSEKLISFTNLIQQRIQTRIPFSAYYVHMNLEASMDVLPFFENNGLQIASLTFEIGGLERLENRIQKDFGKIACKVPNLKSLTLIQKMKFIAVSSTVLHNFVKALPPSLGTLNLHQHVDVDNMLDFPIFVETLSNVNLISPLTLRMKVSMLNPNQFDKTKTSVRHIRKVQHSFSEPNLQLNLIIVGNEEMEVTDMCARLIHTSSKYLKTLRFEMSWLPNLRLPSMPNLEQIALQFNYNPVKSIQFDPAVLPYLKRVSLYYDRHNCNNESIFLQTPFGSAIFSTVETFMCKGFGLGLDLSTISWHIIFPNLKSLRYYDSPSTMDVNYIATKLTMIQHLAFYDGYNRHGAQSIFGDEVNRTNGKTVNWPFSKLLELKTLEFSDLYCVRYGVLSNLAALTLSRKIQPLEKLLLNDYSLYKKTDRCMADAKNILTCSNANWHKNILVTNERRAFPMDIGYNDESAYMGRRVNF